MTIADIFRECGLLFILEVVGEDVVLLTEEAVGTVGGEGH